MSESKKQAGAVGTAADIEAKVEAQLKKMTLEEKVGQMCQLYVPLLADQSKEEFALDPASCERVFNQYKVGSVFMAPHCEAQEPATWVRHVRNVNTESSKRCNGVPVIYGSDQNHGSTYTLGGTLFPQEINQASSFNRDVVRRVAEITAYEARACLIPWVFNPTMDLGRNPLWPRMWESYGEDVYVNSEMGATCTRACQGSDRNHIDMYHVAGCMKHFMAYGVPMDGKDRSMSSVTDREMREKFFEPYRHCVEAGALSVMINSAPNNGRSFHVNKLMIQGWLKDELHWDGMAITDFGDIRNVFERDHLTETYKDAVELCINAGIDMVMEPFDPTICDLLKELVLEGRVPAERIDDACRRILRLKYRLNLMDTSTWDLTPDEVAAKYPKVGSDAFGDESTRITEECMVLLKNDPVNGGKPILPLQPNTKLLVCGPNADTFRAMNGGWTYTHQGHITDEVCRSLRKHNYKTFYEALRDKLGEKNVKIVEGVSYKPAPRPNGAAGGDTVTTGYFFEEESDTIDIEAAVREARKADVVMAFVGENSYCEWKANIKNLELSRNQQALVAALAETGKPLVLVLNEGRPRIISDIEPLSVATITTMLPGTYGGVALANLLTGDANFSAKLPFTYPRHPATLVTYDHKPCQKQPGEPYDEEAELDVLYPFGHGLSYTTFEYSDLTVDKTVFNADDTLTFAVTVKNVGTRAGKEAVLLYTSDLHASISPDTRRLRAFTKIYLDAGERETVRLSVKGSELAFVGMDNHWVLEKGKFVAHCGGHRVEFSCSETKRWSTPNR